MDDRKFRIELTKMNCKVSDIFFARQAVLYVRDQVWDKSKKISSSYKRKLRDSMLSAFNNSDLDSLCFNLFGKTGVAEGIQSKARIENLIGYCERLSDTATYELIARCYWERPDRDWDWDRSLTSDTD